MKNNFNTNLLIMISSFATILKGNEVNICISSNNVTLIMINSDTDT